MTVLCENIEPNGDTLIIIPYSTVSSESSDDSVAKESSHIEDPRSESGHEPSTEVDRSMPSGIGEATHRDEGTDPVTELRFKVSRSHLIVASRRARRMFQGQYLETQKSEIDGCYHWKMEPLFDPEALGIVLRIIHARNQDLPDDVTLEMLVSIGKVVDDLQCHEALSFFAKVWTSRISEPIPLHMCDELIRWIFVASVFEYDEYLKKATKVALMESTGRIDGLGLPIISEIIDKIERKRQQLLNDLADQLQASLDSLYSTSGCHAPQCTSVMIGVLVKYMKDLKLLLSTPKEAFPKMSLSSAFKTVRSFDSPPLYLGPQTTTQQATSSYYSSGSQHKENVWVLKEETYWTYPKDLPKQLMTHQCRLQTLLEPKIAQLETQAKNHEFELDL
ncbi:hypothetical protein FSHL1_005186 [Fusarium sambucinum]